MTWYSPIFFADDEHRTAHGMGGIGSVGGTGALSVRGGLGSAQASGQWTWATTPPERAGGVTARPSSLAATRAASAGEGACVRAPVELLGRMSAVAQAMGRSESDVWVEAAREWLRRREGESGAPPAAAAPSVTLVGQPRRRDRIWEDIDALLLELRAPASAHEGVSAA